MNYKLILTAQMLVQPFDQDNRIFKCKTWKYS